MSVVLKDHIIVEYGMLKHGTIRYGTVRYGTVWYGTVRCRSGNRMSIITSGHVVGILRSR